MVLVKALQLAPQMVLVLASIGRGRGGAGRDGIASSFPIDQQGAHQADAEEQSDEGCDPGQQIKAFPWRYGQTGRAKAGHVVLDNLLPS